MNFTTQWKVNGHRGVTVSCSGLLTESLIRNMNETVLGNEQIRIADYVVLNTLGIDEVSIKSRELNFYGASDAAAASYMTKPDMKFAIVTDNEEIKNLFNLYRNVSHKAGNTWDIKIMCTMEEAKEWIDA